jgi:hypothetical protein
MNAEILLLPGGEGWDEGVLIDTYYLTFTQALSCREIGRILYLVQKI